MELHPISIRRIPRVLAIRPPDDLHLIHRTLAAIQWHHRRVLAVLKRLQRARRNITTDTEWATHQAAAISLDRPMVLLPILVGPQLHSLRRVLIHLNRTITDLTRLVRRQKLSPCHS